MALLKKIDELTEDDHAYITSADDCFYFLEYPNGGTDLNKGNPDFSFIHNFKKSVDRIGTSQWQYKTREIRRTANMFHGVFLMDNNLAKYTIVPVPPSKCKTDPLYDPRMQQVIDILVDINPSYHSRDVVESNQSKVASHEAIIRPSIQELKDNYSVSNRFIDECRKHVMIVDDVLTTGAHFCAIREIIHERRPDIIVKGLFIARRLVPDAADDFDDLDIDWDF